MVDFYNGALKNIKDLRLPGPLNEHESVFLYYNIIFKDEETRNRFIEHIKINGIPSRVTYNPVHLFTFYKEKYNCKEGDLPVTEDISKRILTIPLHLGLNRENLNYIAEKIKEFFS